MGRILDIQAQSLAILVFFNDSWVMCNLSRVVFDAETKNVSKNNFLTVEKMDQLKTQLDQFEVCSKEELQNGLD